MNKTFIGRLATIPLCLSLLTACSTSFTYNQLDWLIPWYLDDYVDLSRDQKAILRAKLDPLLHWHRYAELEQYIEILDRIEQDLHQPVDSDIVQNWIDEIIRAAGRVEVSFLEMALEFGESMSDEQMVEFKKSLWERQRELKKKYLKRNDQEYSRDNYKSIAKNLRRFSGRLKPEQKRRLQEAADSLQRFDRVWLQDRQEWLAKLEPLLQKKTGWQQAISHAYAQREQDRSVAYQEHMQYNMHVLSQAVADVLNTLDEKQRARTFREIEDYRDELRRLARQTQQADAA
jgi:uncharacterized protein (UPF0216 family)